MIWVVLIINLIFIFNELKIYCYVHVIWKYVTLSMITGDTYINVVQGIEVHEIMQPFECFIWILKVEGRKW